MSLKKLLFSLVFTLLCFSIKAQSLWVIDSLSLKPIASAKMYTDQGVFYSDSNGFIQVDKTLSGQIWVNRLDYKKKWLTYNKNIDTIYMLTDDRLLQPFTITGKLPKNKSVEIGYHDKGHFLKKKTLVNNRSIIAVYIPNYRSDSYIRKIILNIKPGKYRKQYNVYLYGLDPEGRPGEILLKKRVSIEELDKEGVIDISNLKIKLPDTGVFVGYENLKKVEYSDDESNLKSLRNKGIYFEYTEKISSEVTYILYKDLKDKSKSNKWIKYIIGNTQVTPCFGLEVNVQ